MVGKPVWLSDIYTDDVVLYEILPPYTYNFIH